MSIIEILKKYSKIEIELLLSHILGKPKEFLYMEPNHKLSSKQYKNIAKLIKRRLAGEPIAYILGYKDFYGLRFKVTKDVLIPRPETEWIVDRIKNLEGRNKNVLDVGTGSGCIAITLAKLQQANNKSQVTASDISPAALKVAKQNAKTHKVKVNFIKSDLFKSINGKFDVIIANLPYVPMEMLKKYVLGKNLDPQSPYSGLKFEPISALTDGTRSFQIYRRFFEEVGGHINSGGIILLEIDPSSRKFLTEYQKKYLPSGEMKFYKDFNKLWRYAEINLNK